MPTRIQKTKGPLAKYGGRKTPMTFQIRGELADKLRAAAWWERMTMTRLLEEALAEKLGKMEKSRGDGYQLVE